MLDAGPAVHGQTGHAGDRGRGLAGEDSEGFPILVGIVVVQTKLRRRAVEGLGQIHQGQVEVALVGLLVGAHGGVIAAVDQKGELKRGGAAVGISRGRQRQKYDGAEKKRKQLPKAVHRLPFFL